MNFVVGLTGGVGSGKSAVSDRFAERGVTIVDADLAARVVVEPGCPALEQICERHGQGILHPDGTLDRKALREVVFADEEERLWLEALLHPLIGNELRRQLSEASARYAMLVSPLLYEAGQVALVDRVLVVDAPEEVRVMRTLARDGGEASTVRSIIKTQMAGDQRLAMADDWIINDADFAHLDSEVERLHRRYMDLALAVH